MRGLKQRIILKRLAGTRIVASPKAIDCLLLPGGCVPMRFAPDEIYVTPPLLGTAAVTAADPYAIIREEGGFSGAWVAEADALWLLERHAAWEMPSDRPAFCQGMVAGVATKLYFKGDKVLFVVPSPYAAELEGRLT